MAYQVSTYSVLGIAKQAQAFDVTTRDGRGGTIVGFQAATNNGGSRITALGYSAAFSNIANDNTAVGYYAGAENSVGYSNVFIGGEAGRGSTEGRKNLFVGNQAGFINNSGFENIYMGNGAARTILRGINNIILGNDAGNDTDFSVTNFYSHIAVGHRSRLKGLGTITHGNDTYNQGLYSIVSGHYTCNMGNNSIVIGNNIINSGANSVIIMAKSNSTPYTNTQDNCININDLLSISTLELKLANSNLISLQNGCNLIRLDNTGIRIINSPSSEISLKRTGLSFAGINISMQSNLDILKDINITGNTYAQGVVRTSNLVYVGSTLYVSSNLNVEDDCFVHGDVDVDGNLDCATFTSSQITVSSLIVQGSINASSTLLSVQTPMTLSNTLTALKEINLFNTMNASNINSSNLYVSRGTHIDYSLHVDGRSTFCNVVNHRAPLYVDSNLVVGLDATFSNNVSILTNLKLGKLASLSNVFIKSSLSNEGTSYFGGVVTSCNIVNNVIHTNSLVSYRASLCNQTSVSGTLQLSTTSFLNNYGNSTLCNLTTCSNLLVNGYLNMMGTLDASTIISRGKVTVCNNVVVLGNIYCSNDVITNNAVIQTNATISNNMLILQGATVCNVLVALELIARSNITASNSLNVLGDAFLNNVVATNIVTLSNITASNNLRVLGKTLLDSTLTVTSNVYMNGQMNINGILTLSNNLTVLDDATFSRNITTNNIVVRTNAIIVGSLTLSNDLTIIGNAVFNSIKAKTIAVSSNLYCSNLTIQGLASFSNNIVCLANATFCNNLRASNLDVMGTFNALNLSVSKTLNVYGAVNLSNSVYTSNLTAGVMSLNSYILSTWYYCRAKCKPPNNITFVNTGTNYYVVPFNNAITESGFGAALVTNEDYTCFKAGVEGVFSVQVYLETQNVDANGFIGLLLSSSLLPAGYSISGTELDYVFTTGNTLKSASATFTPYMLKDERMYIVSKDEVHGVSTQADAINQDTSYATVALMNSRSL